MVREYETEAWLLCLNEVPKAQGCISRSYTSCTIFTVYGDVPDAAPDFVTLWLIGVRNILVTAWPCGIGSLG